MNNILTSLITALYLVARDPLLLPLATALVAAVLAATIAYRLGRRHERRDLRHHCDRAFLQGRQSERAEVLIENCTPPMRIFSHEGPLIVEAMDTGSAIPAFGCGAASTSQLSTLNSQLP